MTPFESQDVYEEERFDRRELEGAVIVGKEFFDCTFTRGAMRECQFTDCRFEGCRFEACDLSMASFDRTIFRDVQFTRSRIVGINWTLAEWSALTTASPFSFDECTLDYSTFMGLTLRQLVATGCSAREVDFSEADLTRSDFSATDLIDARFQQTDLSEANLETASNYRIDVRANKVSKARFSLPEAVALLRSLDIVLVDD